MDKNIYDKEMLHDRKMLKSMFETQDELNTLTIGESWHMKGSTPIAKIRWDRCIILELAELVESLPWKHWKKEEADIDNARVEIIDTMHFVMSHLMCKNAGIDSVDVMLSKEAIEIHRLEYEIKEDLDVDGIISDVEEIEKLLKEGYSVFALLMYCFDIAHKLGLDNEAVYKLYYGKAILNLFRLQNGYQDGTYIKKWNGLEDNVIMMDILDTLNDKDCLLEELEARYSKVS